MTSKYTPHLTGSQGYFDPNQPTAPSSATYRTNVPATASATPEVPFQTIFKIRERLLLDAVSVAMLIAIIAIILIGLSIFSEPAPIIVGDNLPIISSPEVPAKTRPDSDKRGGRDFPLELIIQGCHNLCPPPTLRPQWASPEI